MTPSLLIKPDLTRREIAIVTPHSAGWQYVGFAAAILEHGEKLTLPAVAEEQCIVVVTGIVSVDAGDEKWVEIGHRRSVFSGEAPYAIYLPPGIAATVSAVSGEAEIGIGAAPATGTLPPRLIEPASMRQSIRGKGSNTRYVTDILPQDEPAESLLVVEVRTPSGHSSSYPPHKHDVDNIPSESLLEETYYHRINPPQGFVFQRIYTDSRDLDESFAVEDRNVVLAPRGYHPVVVPHGYESYYLNIMAGPKRVWHFHNDPAHEWILAAN